MHTYIINKMFFNVFCLYFSNCDAIWPMYKGKLKAFYLLIWNKLLGEGTSKLKIQTILYFIHFHSHLRKQNTLKIA